MSRRRLGVALAAALVLGIGRDANAGMLDIIWELSGPRMIGVSAFCRVSLTEDLINCRIAAAKIQATTGPRAWLTGEAGIMTSIPHNGFSWGDAYMVVLDPMFETRWVNQRVAVYSGVGATYNIVFGPDFDTFDRLGFKFRPVAVEWSSGWGLQYNVRLYTDEFGRDLFGRGRSFRGNRPHEVVQTGAVIIPIGRW